MKIYYIRVINKDGIKVYHIMGKSFTMAIRGLEFALIGKGLENSIILGEE